MLPRLMYAAMLWDPSPESDRELSETAAAFNDCTNHLRLAYLWSFRNDLSVFDLEITLVVACVNCMGQPCKIYAI